MIRRFCSACGERDCDSASCTAYLEWSERADVREYERALQRLSDFRYGSPGYVQARKWADALFANLPPQPRLEKTGS